MHIYKHIQRYIHKYMHVYGERDRGIEHNVHVFNTWTIVITPDNVCVIYKRKV